MPRRVCSLQSFPFHGRSDLLPTIENDNLRNEYSSLFEDVPSDIPFARIALRKDPEAVNFWLGNSLSTTSLHKDNYENIYVQVRGQKHFVIMPPVAAAAVNEQSISGTTYTSTNGDEEAELKVEDLKHTLDEPELIVPVPTWDPDFPDVRSTPYSELVKPLRITLNEGDMMYLPAQWYHKVGQSCGDEGYCCAVNYWSVFPDLAPSPFAAMYGFTMLLQCTIACNTHSLRRHCNSFCLKQNTDFTDRGSPGTTWNSADPSGPRMPLPAISRGPSTTR